MKLLLVAFCLMLQGILFSQYKFMEEMKESTIHIGSGNYFYHVENESAVKGLVNQIIKLNRMPHDVLLFNKGKNLYFSGYQVNPVDDSYIYLIYAIRTREGFDVYCLYCENIYIHFFDYNEEKSFYSLIFDPIKNNLTTFTNLPGILQDNLEEIKD
jgi:hypothetical protein